MLFAIFAVFINVTKIKMFSFLKFWLKSSNQHGLHSPFVYNYLTKGLYDAKNVSNDKQLNWMLKSVAYFKPNKIFVADDLKKGFCTYEGKFVNTIHDADLIFVTNHSLQYLEDSIKQMTPIQLLFVCNIKYDSKKQLKLRLNNEVVLVVDFYVGSLISKRTEQLKQNFFLRL